MLAAGIIIFSLMACGPKPNYGVSEFEIGQEFDLGVGKTAKLSNGSLKVTFNAVSEDSRCPDGVNCMWAGKVVANLTVANAEGSQAFDFTREGKSSKPTTKQFKDWTIRLHDVAPYPKDGVKLDKQRYSVRISVVR